MHEGYVEWKDDKGLNESFVAIFLHTKIKKPMFVFNCMRHVYVIRKYNRMCLLLATFTVRNEGIVGNIGIEIYLDV